MTTLAQSMTEAWLARARSAEADLNAAATAPAFFKPEWVERASQEYAHAMQQARYWHSQAVRA